MLISDTSNLTKGSEKRIKTKCDICKIISETNYANYYNSQVKRNWPLTTYCRKCACKISANKRRGKPAHNKGKKLSQELKGSNHPSWKGGTYISHDGYRMIYCPIDNPKNKWKYYRKEHIVVIEEYLGRKLAKGEVIHHIDGNKLNNTLNNLIVLDQKHHRQLHAQLQSISYLLIENGYIRYDLDKQEYQIVEKLKRLLK